MNTTYLILGTILAIVSIIETTEGWRDGRKWRERRIAHVFGKRNGADSNIDLPPLFLPRNDQLSILDQEDKSGEDYDQKYATDTDHIPQSVMDRYGPSIITGILSPITFDVTSIGFHKNLGSSFAIKFCCNRIVISRLEGKQIIKHTSWPLSSS